MLPKKKRITKNLFQELMKNGRIIQSPLFLFRYKAQNGPSYAFVAPKTVVKSAVGRTLLRRKGYNRLRNIALLPYQGIFFFKKPAKTATSGEIEAEIKALFSKIAL